MKLLTESAKTIKSTGMGVMTGAQYLAPADASGRNVCPFASAACRSACLGIKSGNMIMSHVRRAQIARTHMRLDTPDTWRAQIEREIAALVRRAERKGMRAAVRLDGTSDLGDAERLATVFPDVQFYDYTKVPARMRRYMEGRTPPNWHLTFSYSGENLDECLRVLTEGGNVAVVFATGRGDALPKTWHGFRVIDGDEHDARFLDPSGVVVGLRLKATRNADREDAIATNFVS